MKSPWRGGFPAALYRTDHLQNPVELLNSTSYSNFVGALECLATDTLLIMNI